MQLIPTAYANVKMSMVGQHYIWHQIMEKLKQLKINKNDVPLKVCNTLHHTPKLMVGTFKTLKHYIGHSETCNELVNNIEHSSQVNK